MALGAAQIGFLLAMEKPMRSWLSRGRVWTTTVLINGLIMPIFLWHSTVMMLLVGGLFWLIPGLLVGEPGSMQWWALRPVWVLVYLSIMVLFLPVFLKLEKIASADNHRSTPLPVLMLASLTLCFGLALLAIGGVSGQGAFGINWWACLLPIGATIVIMLTGQKTNK